MIHGPITDHVLAIALLYLAPFEIAVIAFGAWALWRLARA